MYLFDDERNRPKKLKNPPNEMRESIDLIKKCVGIDFVSEKLKVDIQTILEYDNFLKCDVAKCEIKILKGDMIVLYITYADNITKNPDRYPCLLYPDPNGQLIRAGLCESEFRDNLINCISNNLRLVKRGIEVLSSDY